MQQRIEGFDMSNATARKNKNIDLINISAPLAEDSSW